jgi:polyhydroxybutyrate depolymerase
VRKTLLLLLFVACSMMPALTQDLKQKGVSYWGQPAAQQLYKQPANVTPQNRYGQPSGYTARTSQASQKNRDHIDFEIVSHGVRRTSIVHIPRDADPRTPLPVILVFHGLGMHAYQMPILTGMNACADRNGFVAVYPDATNGRWDDGFTGADHGDVEFIEDLISSLPRLTPINNHRIYACGISNGGFFSQRLACDLGSKIAGIAVVAATSYRTVCNRCSSPLMPVMFFNGTDDSLIPFDASKIIDTSSVAEKTGLPALSGISGAMAEFTGLFSAPDAVGFWVRHNGAGSARTSRLSHLNRDPCTVTLDDYGSGRSEVAAYTIEKGGHTWPGGMPIPGQILGTTAMDVNASEAICEFFRSR